MKNPATTPRTRTAKRAVRSHKKKERLKPVSLHPLDFDTAMKGLVAVRSEPQEAHREKQQRGS
jgi:hypothetical protein